jgi:sterol desaturase/sphingolipid hydroxylase (fatty acid hydroxylase superfamily)
VDALVARLGEAATPFTNLSSKTAWPYLVSGVALAVVVWLVRRRRDETAAVSLRRFLFPREVYGHQSARLDYRFVAIDLLLRALVYLPVITAIGALSHHAAERTPLVGRIGHVLAHIPGHSLIVGLTLFLLVDLSLYLVHLTAHLVPSLWAFHEVHHSAEVLTPLTVHRVHPLEELANYVGIGVFGGVGSALWGAASGHEIGLPTVLGVNALTVLFYGVAYQLRHSHIWLSYGPRLSRILISPAQHQIHHSRAQQHWDKNMGFVFAFWDGLFGTLYVPTEREEIEFGVAGGNPADYATVRSLYLRPFPKALERRPRIVPRRRQAPAA